MNGLALLLVAATGIDYGWQPGKDGQLEYIVQIEPALIEALKSGQEIASEIPAELRGVRRVRIRVGTGQVPRTMTPPGGYSGENGRGTPGQDRAWGGGAAVPGTPSPLGTQRAAAADNARGVIDSSGGNGMAPDRSGSSLLDLPPPPWTEAEQNQLHSVLVGGPRGGRGGETEPRIATNPRSLPEAGSAVLPPADPSATGSGAAPAPSRWSLSDPGSTTAAPAEPGNWPPQPPANVGSGFSTDANDAATNPANSTPNSNPWPAYGSRPGSGTVLPPKPIPSPEFNQTDAPIRDPDARTDSGGGKLKARISAGPARPPADSGGTGANLGPAADRRADTAANQDRPTRRELREPASITAPEPAIMTAAAGKPTLDAETAEQLAAEEPWLPLVLTSLALFMSLAANAYLGWIAAGAYRRYRDVVQQLRQAVTTV